MSRREIEGIRKVSKDPDQRVFLSFWYSNKKMTKKAKIEVTFNNINPKEESPRKVIRTASYFSANLLKCIPRRETRRYSKSSRKAATSKNFSAYSNSRPCSSVFPAKVIFDDRSCHYVEQFPLHSSREWFPLFIMSGDI